MDDELPVERYARKFHELSTALIEYGLSAEQYRDIVALITELVCIGLLEREQINEKGCNN